MSARALEFVETWVSQQIEATNFAAVGGATPGDPAQAKALAAQCVQDAQRDGIAVSEIGEAFDDLAAFIAAQIDEARERATGRSDEDDGARLVEDDDTRLVDEDEDEAEEDAKGA